MSKSDVPTEDPQAFFRALVKEKCAERHWSAAQLARRCGQTPTYLRDWISGCSPSVPSIRRLHGILCALDIDLIAIVKDYFAIGPPQTSPQMAAFLRRPLANRIKQPERKALIALDQAGCFRNSDEADIERAWSAIAEGRQPYYGPDWKKR